MKSGSRRFAFLVGASLIASVAAGEAVAQTGASNPQVAEDPAAPVDQPEAGETDDTIYVTVRRRSEALQDVPAAITAFTADTIEAAGIERPLDFINLTSNVNLVETQNAGNAFIIIRGNTHARNSQPSGDVTRDG